MPEMAVYIHGTHKTTKLAHNAMTFECHLRHLPCSFVETLYVL